MKIKNLKEKIDAPIVKKFKFGDEDANQDKLLLTDKCFCSIGGINEILLGNKNYVLGVKGTGKTAIFKMLKEKMLSLEFEDQRMYNQYFFDDTLLFEVLNSFVSDNIESEKGTSKSVKYQIVWELYFLYNIISDLHKNPSDLPISNELKIFIDNFNLAYNLNTSFHFMDIIKNMKTTLHVQYDQLTHIIIPGITFEQNKNGSESDSKIAAKYVEININKIKECVSLALVQSKRYIAILIDRLDDFVTKNEYDIQREIISSLVKVERSYSTLNNIHFIIFMRNDLFEKIDYTDIGYDKIINRKVELVWKPENIREFIGRRIVANYAKYIKISLYQIERDDKKKTQNIFKKVILNIIGRGEIVKDQNTLDDFNRALINTLFRKTIICYDQKGNRIQKNIFDYLETYFCLANGFSNPRVILIYLETVMEKLRAFIDSNFIKEFRIDQNGCYNMISDDILSRSYLEFQDKMNDVFSKIDKRNEKFFEIFRYKIGNRPKIKAEEIIEMLGRKKREQILDFIVFLEYSMYLKSLSAKNSPVILRTYEIPVMFRKITIKNSHEEEK